MLTRVRIEAEGSTPDEVEKILQMAHAKFQENSPLELRTLFGNPLKGDGGKYYPGLADAQAGEFVIERFSGDTRGEDGEWQAGTGVIFYKGRMTTHYAKPKRAVKLDRHHDDPNPVGYQRP